MAIRQTPELDRILQQAVDQDASHIYLFPGEPLSFRVHGVIERQDNNVLTAEPIEQIAIAAVGKDALAKIRTQAGGCVTGCDIPGVVHGRLTIASALGDWSITIRVYPTVVLDAVAIDMPAAMLMAAKSPRGLVVFAGESGSGKTTNALSFLEHINATRNVHISTIEDPVAVRLTPKRALIRQHEVGTDVPDTLAALRYVLVEDVDVLYMSVLRNVEEVAALITAAEYGALVVVVLHAASPEEAIERMMDALNADSATAPLCKRLAHALRAVSVQRLLPKAHEKGVVPAYGVLVPDDETRQTIVDGTDLRKRVTPPPAGCQTLAQDIERLARQGVISDETAQSALRDMQQ